MKEGQITRRGMLGKLTKAAGAAFLAATALGTRKAAEACCCI